MDVDRGPGVVARELGDELDMAVRVSGGQATEKGLVEDRGLVGWVEAVVASIDPGVDASGIGWSMLGCH